MPITINISKTSNFLSQKHMKIKIIKEDNSNLSKISFKSSYIESYRNNKDIKEKDNNHIMINEEEKNLRVALSIYVVFRVITVKVLNSCINQCFLETLI